MDGPACECTEREHFSFNCLEGDPDCAGCSSTRRQTEGSREHIDRGVGHRVDDRPAGGHHCCRPPVGLPGEGGGRGAAVGAESGIENAERDVSTGGARFAGHHTNRSTISPERGPGIHGDLSRGCISGHINRPRDPRGGPGADIAVGAKGLRARGQQTDVAVTRGGDASIHGHCAGDRAQKNFASPRHRHGTCRCGRAALNRQSACVDQQDQRAATGDSQVFNRPGLRLRHPRVTHPLEGCAVERIHRKRVGFFNERPARPGG